MRERRKAILNLINPEPRHDLLKVTVRTQTSQVENTLLGVKAPTQTVVTRTIRHQEMVSSGNGLIRTTTFEMKRLPGVPRRDRKGHLRTPMTWSWPQVTVEQGGHIQTMTWSQWKAL